MIHRKRTHKDVTDTAILTIWNEAKAEAKRLYPHYFENCEPELYQDSSYSHLGLCSQSYTNPREKNVDKIKQSRCIITISSNLGKDYDQIRSTICHELGHFVAPKENHGYIWRARADKIGAKWNIVASRLTNNDTFNNAAAKARDAKATGYKYRLYCPSCGTEWKYKTNCQAVKYASHYRCGKCKSALKSEQI